MTPLAALTIARLSEMHLVPYWTDHAVREVKVVRLERIA